MNKLIIKENENCNGWIGDNILVIVGDNIFSFCKAI
jgi:hypothetical protein